MGNAKDRLKFSLQVVPCFPLGIVQWVKRKCVWKYIVSPHMRKVRHGREREKWGTTGKAFAFDFANSDWFFHGNLSTTVKNAAAANDSSMREGIPLDALNWHSKIDQLAVKSQKHGFNVCSPSLFSFFAASCLSHVGWYNVFSHTFVFCSLYYPWGKSRNSTHSLP